MKVSSLLANSHKEKGLTDWYSLFFNNERVGLLLLHSKMIPNRDGKKAYRKLERNMTQEQELEQAKYESLKLDRTIAYLQEQESQNSKLLSEITAGTDRSQAQRLLIEKTFNKYHNSELVFEDSTRNFDYDLQEIVMNPDSIRCKCSIDDPKLQKEGETAKCSHILNLIKGGQQAENVWTVNNFQAVKKKTFWEISFNSPVLIRGFAI